MAKLITSEMVTAYSLCPRKAFLLECADESIKSSDFLQLMEIENKKSRENYFNNVAHKSSEHKYCKVIKAEDLSGYIDVVEYFKNKINTTATPTLIVGTHKHSRQHKLHLAFIGYILFRHGEELPSHGYLINRACSRTKITLSKFYKEVETILAELRNWQSTDRSEPPAVCLNKHCTVCGYEAMCRSTAEQEDHLSLLSGIQKKDIYKLNQKGIFTVNQLSYTYRARKNKTNKLHSYPLKARALRERQIYVHEMPEVPESKVEIYFDIEGIPDQNFQYLIGVLVHEEDDITHHYFWANSKDEELKMLKNFLSLLDGYEDYTLFHYGSYETTYLKRITKTLNNTDTSRLELALSACFNILSITYSNLYFPSLSNGLKSIANSIGFEWTDPLASGLQSIAWRCQWEQSRAPEFKEKLITYNREDCEALFKVRQVIRAITKAKECHVPYDMSSNNSQLESPGLSFQRKNFALPEMESINRWSYFDYQEDHVHIRKAKIKKAARKRKKTDLVSSNKINKHITIIPSECPNCGQRSLKDIKLLSKKIIDLTFFEAGAKRWVTLFTSHEYVCLKCNNKFVPKQFKEIPRHRYGHNLKAWAIYQHIVNRESLRQIESNCLELFSIHLPSSSSHVFKDYLADYYNPTYQKLISKILDSHVVYIDETPFKLKSETVYAWVLTNGCEVVSLYRPTREGKFLKALFSGYKGVVVSDGYSAYDSLDVQQQKCLIHIIRDINHDLLKNPFDSELKEIARSFTALLQQIIETIDRFGLKKYYLKKHKKAAHIFLNAIAESDYHSEVAQQYKKRFIKNNKSLFEFLNHDNVSWNNTSAEHAIKLLSVHRNLNIKFLHKSKMDAYLRVMSLYQTCEYLGISFLRFMISGETDIDHYSIRSTIKNS